MQFVADPGGLNIRVTNFSRIIFFVAFVCVSQFLCHAQTSVLVYWDANSESDLAGYRVYWGTASRDYTETLDVGNITEGTVTDLQPSTTYFFAVTAYNTAQLESDYSDEVSYTVPASGGGNAAPVVLDLSVGTDEDTSVEIMLSGSDSDQDPLTFEIIDPPQAGTLTGTPPNLTYQPAANYSGDDSLTYRATDGSLTSTPGTVDFSVAPVNDPPIAHSLSNLVTDPTTPLPLPVSVLGSDIDSSALSIQWGVTFPGQGTIVGAPPTFTYQPNADFVGTDTISFRVFDGELYSDPATVSIRVEALPLNEPPVVSAGIDQIVTLPAQAILSGTATDADLSAGEALIHQWSVIDGPGPVTFTDANALDSRARFELPGDYLLQLSTSDGESSTQDTLAITVQAIGGNRLFLHEIEAEHGSIVSPMASQSEPPGDSGFESVDYIATSSSHNGLANYHFEIPATGEYVVWCRLLAPSGGRDSFFVSVDGSNEDVCDASEEDYADRWQWKRINGRGGSDQPFEAAYTLNPRVFSLEAGTHTITFRGREPNTRLDSFIVTNDPDFHPLMPRVRPLESYEIGGGYRLPVVTWSSEPGQAYRVYASSGVGANDWRLVQDQNGNSEFTAIGTETSVNDIGGIGAGTRIYRVELIGDLPSR